MAATGADALDDAAQLAGKLCAAYLGSPVQSVETPGNRRNPTFRARLEWGSVIVTRRANPRRARLEADVLRSLGARGAPVPRVLAFDGEWLIQEDLGHRRLSQALADAPAHVVQRWLDAALGGLARSQTAGRSADLRHRTARIGARPGWLDNLTGSPRRFATRMGVAPPPLPEIELQSLLRPRTESLIKWDARPGNAIARDDGTVAWFDWEHCGRRDPLDDVAWLLCDEYVPDLPEVEARLLELHLPTFAQQPDAAAYLAAFGALHMCFRLELILKTKGDGPWWRAERCLADDRVGVMPDAALRTCRRAARWAERCALTEALAPWMLSLPARLEIAEAHPTSRSAAAGRPATAIDGQYRPAEH